MTYYYIGINITNNDDTFIFIDKYFNNIQQRLYLSPGSLFSYEYNKYYTLRITLIYNTSIQWNIKFNDKHVSFTETSSLLFITHSKFIGLKNNNANITAKSLFVTDTPIYNIFEDLSWTQCTTSPTMYPTIHPTTHPTIYPTIYPTLYPTTYPTSSPTNVLTNSPSKSPAKPPTKIPTEQPSVLPTKEPTEDEGGNFNPSTTSNKNNKLDENEEDAELLTELWIVIVLLCALILLVAMISCYIFISVRRKRSNKQTENMEMVSSNSPLATVNEELEHDNIHHKPELKKDGFYARAISEYVDNNDEDQLNFKRRWIIFYYRNNRKWMVVWY